MKFYKLITLSFLSTALLLTSCKKDEEATSSDNSTTTSENNSTSDAMFGHIFDVANTEMNKAEVDSGFQTGKNLAQLSALTNDQCANIKVTLSSDKKYIETLVIDYGTNGCQWNGRTRKGKINIHSTGKMRDKGTVLTITPENLTIDGYKVEGTKKITSNGLDLTNLEISYEIVVTDGKITSPDASKTFQWNTTRTTKIKLVNNVIEVHYTGTAAGINQNGIPFTITIDQTLVARTGCAHFVSGIITVKPEGFKNRSVNYGDGTCDNKAVVSIGSNFSKEITLN